MSTPPPNDLTARRDSDAPVSRRHRGETSQFAPGTMIAGRYRIAGILGSGGMGEVYRADDTKLDQHVALKFLPPRLERDPTLLGHLHDEVRLGRQIAHPNVCRIYDIVEWEGAHFVAMEFVDGEDLGRLLLRIGRLAEDKAVDIARGIAAGLMAAHAKGILHRDLKPANVMIDSRGEARIMDFGLALSTDDDDRVIAGTPAYMAPEQVQGKTATVQSDLYALGLVMFELFTGKRALTGRTLPERLRELSSDITTPSSLIRDLDPSVERIILRCLASDPAERPRSAREVILSLPGGDPLAAAMAAGETPSPRVVAAAGSEGRLRPRVAWTLLGTIAVLLALVLLRVQDSRVMQRLGLTRPPEVLEGQASDLLRRFGIPEQRVRSSGFEEKSAHEAWVYLNDHSPKKWASFDRGLPMLTFWLREEAKPLLDHGPFRTPEPDRTSPPQVEPGSSAIEIDPHGRLVSLRVISTNDWKPRTLDWHVLLDAAGLPLTSLTRTSPTEIPQSFADASAAWSGRHPDDGTPIRVEAAAFRGVPIHFRIVGPWDAKDLTAQMPFGRGAKGDLFLIVLFTSALTIGGVLGWRNLRMRRGDRQAATRIALAIFALRSFAALVMADHAPSFFHEFGVFMTAMAENLLWAALFAVLYIALEPYVRRRWPDRLISWARLVSGKWRDPMVGRDVLIGIVGGLLHSVIAAWTQKTIELATGTPAQPFRGILSRLANPAAGFAQFASGISNGIAYGMVLMTTLMVLTIVMRRRWLAVGSLGALILTSYLLNSVDRAMVPGLILNAALMTFVLARYGLLANAAMTMTFFAIFFAPLPDAFAWYTARGLVPLILLLALSAWAFHTSLGGQRAFATNALDD